MRYINALVFWLIVAVVGLGAFAYSGVFQVGADVPHHPLVDRAIAFARTRAIRHRLADIRVPPLDDPALVKAGAQFYSRLCVNCHVAPGKAASPLHQYLLPQPPDLTESAPVPKEAFWVIKHGIKMSGMPAWGGELGDQQIWALVAYLMQQPELWEDEYDALVAQ